MIFKINHFKMFIDHIFLKCIGFSSFLFFILHVIHKSYLVLMERSLYSNRYENFMNIIYDAWPNNYVFYAIILPSALLFAVCLFIGDDFMLKESVIAAIEEYGVRIIIVPIALVFFFQAITNHSSTIELRRIMRSVNGLDYGSGMAYNYYYGYLQHMLPANDGGAKGMKERIDDFIDDNNLSSNNVPVKRLFLLIPRSMYSPPKFTKDESLHFETKLDKVLKDRGGVIKRQYHNTVYKILSKKSNRNWYVVAEAATPLLTFYEATKGHMNPQLNVMKIEIVKQFVCTLTDILSSEVACRGLWEIVEYDDSIQDIKTGELIETRIERILEQENSTL